MSGAAPLKQSTLSPLGRPQPSVDTTRVGTLNRDARSHVVQSAVRRRDRRLPASSSSNPDAGAITAARRARTKRSR